MPPRDAKHMFHCHTQHVQIVVSFENQVQRSLFLLRGACSNPEQSNT